MKKLLSNIKSREDARQVIKHWPVIILGLIIEAVN